MSRTVVVVDAFTDQPFRGNPAAVCVLDAPADESWMRDVAREINLSETAFLHPEKDGFRLRWLTPAVEVDLCGHATLASAHVLWTEGHLAPTARAHFHTRSGLLTADRVEDRIRLDFPSKRVERKADPTPFEDALGVRPVAAWWNEYDALVELPDEATVRGLAPDFGKLKRIEARGVIVTAAASTPEIDFVSRFFAPASGIDEDPVTGSAHCCLGPFWAERIGRNRLRAYQASARGGHIEVVIDEDRVQLLGKAVTVTRGELLH